MTGVANAGDGAPMAVFERGRHRSVGAVPGSRSRERTERWPHRPHPVKGTGGRGSFRYRRLRSRLDSKRFMPEKVIPSACEHVYRALRPGGWLLFAMANPGTDTVTTSLVRVRTVLWGGCLMAPGQVETLLKGTGFVDVRTLASPPGAIVALIAARRAPNQ